MGESGEHWPPPRTRAEIVAAHGPGYSGEEGFVNQLYLDPGGWHVFAVDWGPDELVFRVDDHGKPFRTSEYWRITERVDADDYEFLA